MTCLIGEAVDGPGMKSHTSMLGTFFVYTLGLSMPIFKKKSLRRFLGKSSKLWVLHEKLFLFSGSLPPLLKDLRNMKDVYDLTLLYYSYVTKTLILRVTTLLYKTFAEIVA